MKIRILFAALFIASMMCSCNRTWTDSELAIIAYEGNGLNSEASEFGSIAPNRWPTAIAQLRPEQVYRTPAGLYIATDSFFVEERGLFVPDPATPFLPDHGSDPSYESLGEGIFAYAIKG